MNFHSIYINLLRNLLENPAFVTSPRGTKTHEILNYSFTIENRYDCKVDWQSTGTPERQAVVEKYWNAELQWYLTGNLEASSAPSKFWLKLADENGKITSNYGYMVFFDTKYNGMTGVGRVVKLLSEDKDSRQAVIHYGEPKNFTEGNKDTPCCMTNQFLVRDNTLHMIVNMRSTDIIKGLTYDVQWFSFLQNFIANKLRISAGPLHYNIASVHLYEKDFALAEKILRT